MYDFHTHTSFSDDCDVSMKDMVTSAINKGITTLAITDHYDPGYPDPEFPFTIDFSDYQTALENVSQLYKNQIKIIKGLEIGIMEGQFESAEKIINEYPYDFIIGSFHCLHKTDLYTFDFSNVDRPAMLKEFYEYVYSCLSAYKNYDVVGHFSIIDRYIGNPLDCTDSMPIIKESLKTIINDGKGIEINTSNFKYGTNMWLPREEILKAYYELGGEILTFGSDSHEPKHLLNHFDDAIELAKTIGFKYFCTFENRKPQFHKL